MKTAIVLTDIHLPFHDEESLRAVEKYMGENRFDYYINLGDLIDFDYISKYNEHNKRGNETKRIRKDYQMANEMLDRHQALIRKNNKHAEFILIQGNHDIRIEKFIDKEPAVEGLLELETGLKLEQRGFKFIKEDKVFRLGKAHFIHGKYTNQYHSAKTVTRYGRSMFYGHTHDIQGFSMVQYGDNSTLVGQSLGCLCNYKQSYLKGNPTAWQQAVTTFYFQDNGNYNYYISRIFDHKFVAPDGKLYQ
jgi:predicted phosphodiesterase